MTPKTTRDRLTAATVASFIVGGGLYVIPSDSSHRSVSDAPASVSSNGSDERPKAAPVTAGSLGGASPDALGPTQEVPPVGTGGTKDPYEIPVIWATDYEYAMNDAAVSGKYVLLIISPADSSCASCVMMARSLSGFLDQHIDDWVGIYRKVPDAWAKAEGVNTFPRVYVLRTHGLAKVGEANEPQQLFRQDGPTVNAVKTFLRTLE